MKYSEYSVIIIGSGAAGLYAALKLSRQMELPDGILIITKSELGESNSRYAQGGIVGVLHQNPGDSVNLHVEDTARGIVDVFESNLEGAVNICSGQPVQLRTIVNKIAELTNFSGKILWGAIPAAFGDDLVVGNNAKLKSIGWTPKYSLEEGLKMTIEWWRTHNV